MSQAAGKVIITVPCIRCAAPDWWVVPEGQPVVNIKCSGCGHVTAHRNNLVIQRVELFRLLSKEQAAEAAVARALVETGKQFPHAPSTMAVGREIAEFISLAITQALPYINGASLHGLEIRPWELGKGDPLITADFQLVVSDRDGPFVFVGVQDSLGLRYEVLALRRLMRGDLPILDLFGCRRSCAPAHA